MALTLGDFYVIFIFIFIQYYGRVLYAFYCLFTLL